ncbi:ARM repeat-containing protein [Yamadazyma tenuis ATCC 10573]|uniref:ARM repeat-containing protein n=1 Tax=Candida tenuis (strain ATCC 10573 / BCRC 21748 / CBS 615 / JCM 9827 / NBRC 10315 / NRRL Y-1498 / VKM Y-70) TaxID=590646 RepID=G3BF52_CANTC|nr:ARM repeat-containing protein [Yamadazyma tenuis ATCC 10573]EGV60638.1 ARM repeat-containing protein [Yamadazyma tenuis ATCC 10573]
MPKSIAAELLREYERDDSSTSESIKETIKSSYNKQSHILTDTLNRRKRWDVTPEEREQLLKAEAEQAALEKSTEPAKQFYEPLGDNEENKKQIEQSIVVAPEIKGLEFYNNTDDKYFGDLKVLQQKKILTGDEKIDVKVMELLLKVKNGNQAVRKRSLRALTDQSKTLGPSTLFKRILPLLIDDTISDQERHILVKLIGRILFKLDELIKPHTHQILVAVSPLLIDEDQTLRLEAREIISNLAKAAGLATILSALRPDLSSNDEYVRNIASRILAVVANSLGLANVLPFLKAVIKSKKSWQTRHTGIKIVQQLCLQLGAGNGTSILPYLQQLVELLSATLSDEMLQIRSISAIAVSQLAETVAPYGIEYFEPVLEPVWAGIKRHRGRALSTFLKCLGSIIPLMAHDANYEEYSNYYTREIIAVISREFSSQDDEMKSSILKILQKLPLSRQLIRDYEKQLYLPFIRYYWNRRTAADMKLMYRLVVNASTELALKLDYLLMVERLILYTKDENEQLRKMAVESIAKIISAKPEELIGSDQKFEEQLVDGVLYAFQEQTTFNKVYLNGLATVCNALGMRLRPHINSILSTVLYQIKNKSPDVRKQASLLIGAIAPVVKLCTEGESETLQKLILILYESLGEVFPDVLAGILSALNACLDSFDADDLVTLSNPSIPQLLPSLSPILKNRQEKVQESCISVVGLIARKSAEVINVREWMRICFDLLDALKSPVKRIRVAANRTFGEIARTVGPQDVLTMLLNNLRVQQRQLRVCTAVAIGIVAEVCSPFTVIPAIMNEYRTPDNNVQNGILKAMTFLFEYIDGNLTKDYLYAITPLLQDALTDRDQVHRQTAATVVKHITLNCEGCVTDAQIDVFVHFMDLLMPNIFETSPHVINRILEAIDSLKNIIGYGRYMNYIWAGLFHPARKVRASYWKLYNLAYVQSADAMVPYYPKLHDIDDVGSSYAVEEFDLFI